MRTSWSGLAHEMRRAVEVGQQPLVRVEHEAVGLLDALDHPALLVQQQRAAGPGGIDVQIEVVCATDLGDRAERIDRADAGSTKTGHDAGRHQALRAVGADRGLEQVGAHGEFFVGRDQAQLAPAEARDRDGLLDRGVGFLGRVEGELRAGAEPFLVGAPIGRPLARAEDRAQRGARCAVLDDAGKAFRQAHHLAQPVEDARLHLGRRGRGLPQHALGAERGGQHLGEHRGRARVAREVGEEVRVLPMRHAGQHDALEIGEDVGERLGRVRRRCRQPRRDLAGPHLCAHRIALDLAR